MKHSEVEKESGSPLSPRWYLLPIITTMMDDEDCWSWSHWSGSHDVFVTATLTVASSSVQSIAADSGMFFLFLWKVGEASIAL